MKLGTLGFWAVVFGNLALGQLFDATFWNLDRKAFQLTVSSEYSSQYAKELAIDSDLTTTFSSKEETSGWFQIALDKKYQVAQIGIRRRKDCCFER